MVTDSSVFGIYCLINIRKLIITLYFSMVNMKPYLIAGHYSGGHTLADLLLITAKL